MRRLQRSGTERLTSLQISQYTLESGESACTSICCKAAITLLREAKTKEIEQMDHGTLTETLSEALFSGVELYERAKTAVDHAAVDEVLSVVPELQAELKVLGNNGIQGVLEPGSTASLREVLEQASGHSERDPQQYVAVVLTKPPESVLLLLPPTASSSSKADKDAAQKKAQESNEDAETTTSAPEEAGTSPAGKRQRGQEEERGRVVGSRTGVGAKHRYHLFDSHPRPQLGITGAYLYSVDSEAELLGRLSTMLPYHQFGRGEGEEGLSLMYNSFEATPLQLRE